ncbi:hypothetical protein GYMLUDRAFT_243768 [Collybiopsis luxurians FD-317 M1]|uniref:F-box domain-containing protein n=1 Tax=Collybiopsis luxurians FD-317 M1 TaxID=944289 RepID=A0A0D0CXU2_9AGAR|nr:hypothetical protein GYMLUDRAFT_243768 [Collybiopsis luxurians FD-317 M1]
MSDNSGLTPTTVRDLEEWSTPERRRGDQPLDPIPNEIYLKILSDMHHKEDLSKLALVCRFFASIAIPRLFKKIFIRFECDQLSKTWKESHTRFYNVLREGDDRFAVSLCRYIRECEIHSTGREPTTIVSLATGDMKNLLSMRNLTTLDLRSLDLSPALF